jgi:hypothetical protein
LGIERQTIIEKIHQNDESSLALPMVTFAPLVNQCAETQNGIVRQGFARFGKPTTNSFFSIEFIEITCLKPYEHFFGIGKRRRCFK